MEKKEKKKKVVVYEQTPELVNTLSQLETILGQLCDPGIVNSLLDNYGVERVTQAITRLNNNENKSIETLSSILEDIRHGKKASA